MFLMRSRHNGHCETCGGPIALGSAVLWSREFGAHHPACWETPSRTSDGAEDVEAALLENGLYNGGEDG